MPRHRFLFFVIVLALVVPFVATAPVAAQAPAPGDPANTPASGAELAPWTGYSKPLDLPNLADFERNRARQRLLESGQYLEALWIRHQRRQPLGQPRPVACYCFDGVGKLRRMRRRQDDLRRSALAPKRLIGGHQTARRVGIDEVARFALRAADGVRHLLLAG